jgi:UDP-glucose 4-epimerase
MRALVTGGAGFIGSHLVERLCRDGHEVRVLDDFSTGRTRNLIEVRDEVDVVEADVRDTERVRRAAARCDVVFHQAALPSVLRSIQKPLETHSVNAAGTLSVLVAARDAGVGRVVFASSSSVYGDSAVLPEHEGLPPAPVSPYAVSKLAGEGYCRAFARLYDLDTVALRYFNVFGPRQRRGSTYAGVIPSFVHALFAGERPLVHGDGRQSRDFTFVENVVDANVRALDCGRADGRIYNVASGRSVSVLELLSELKRLTSREVAPVFGPPRGGDVRRTLADLRRARRELGYEPRVGFPEGLALTVGSYERELPAAALEGWLPLDRSA